MGHTLVARVDTPDFALVNYCLSEWPGQPVNKIPFGRDCDRKEANRRFPYHVTLAHWGQALDAEMLSRAEGLRFFPFSIVATHIRGISAAEGSSMLYLTVAPGKDFYRWDAECRRVFGGTCASTSSYHITLAISKDRSEIIRIGQYLGSRLTMPFQIAVNRVELYHIWNPVRLVRAWP